MRSKRKYIRQKRTYLPLLAIITVSTFYVITGAYEPTWCYNWDGIRKNIRDTVRYIDRFGYIPSPCDGYGCTASSHLSSWFWLKKNMTTEEAQKLRKYPRAAIKTLAYEELLIRCTNK